MTSTPYPSAADPSMLSSSKRALRSAIKMALKSVSEESCNAQSETATRLLMSMPEWKDAKRVSVFLSMPGGEVQTGGIVRKALEEGKSVYIPYIRPTPRIKTLPDAPPAAPAPGVMDMLSLSSLSDLDSLKPDSWGIPTIPADSVPKRKNIIDELAEARENNQATKPLDLVVMPGLGFDTMRNRVGHGKGFYDFWLERYRVRGLGGEEGVHGEVQRKGMPRLVALALKEQVVEDGRIPTGETDWKMDAVVVGDGRVIRHEDK